MGAADGHHLHPSSLEVGICPAARHGGRAETSTVAFSPASGICTHSWLPVTTPVPSLIGREGNGPPVTTPNSRLDAPSSSVAHLAPFRTGALGASFVSTPEPLEIAI
jgi:hypothetical protein